MAIAMPSKPNVTPAAAKATAPDMTPLPSDIAKMMPSQPTTSPLPIVNQSAVLKCLTLSPCLSHLEPKQTHAMADNRQPAYIGNDFTGSLDMGGCSDA